MIASVAAGVGCAEAVVLMVEADWGWTASEVVAVPAPEAPFSSVLFGLTSRSTSRCRKTRIFSSFYKLNNISKYHIIAFAFIAFQTCVINRCSSSFSVTNFW